MIWKRLSATRHRVPKNPKKSQKNQIILKKFHKYPKPKCISHKTSHPLAILICKRPSAKRHKVPENNKKTSDNFEKNPSLMRFGLLMTWVLQIWVMRIFSRPKKCMSQGLGVVGFFSDNLGAPTKQQIGLTKSTSYIFWYAYMQETVSKEAQSPVVHRYKICT